MQKHDNTEFLSGILLYENKCKNRVFQIQFNTQLKRSYRKQNQELLFVQIHQITKISACFPEIYKLSPFQNLLMT